LSRRFQYSPVPELQAPDQQPMKLVIFGLSISSSWGNGHATLWRGLCRVLAERGHRVVFFERDTPYYAAARDISELPGGQLRLYSDWSSVASEAGEHMRDADAGIVTSFCPDGVAASELVLSSPASIRVFYDLDTPVTLEYLRAGESLSYIGPRGLRDFDLVLSYTGGGALRELRDFLGARRVVPLYGSVDPDAHFPTAPVERFRSDLSYLGTYSPDRQGKLQHFLLEPARRLPQRRFTIAGASYPDGFPWMPNLSFVRHLPPQDHSAFYCSTRLTLNITRRPMAAMGYCPSGRLFEAAACGSPILTDDWEGLDQFFQPGREILVARTTENVLDAMDLPACELARIGGAGRTRVFEEHTAAHRARQLEAALENVYSGI
jgi:spore maturation protein CgeB